jgi:hypothetical protein
LEKPQRTSVSRGNGNGRRDGERWRDAIEWSRRLSQATKSNIRQNLFFAFIYNAAGIPLAAGALYPTFGMLRS